MCEIRGSLEEGKEEMRKESLGFIDNKHSIYLLLRNLIIIARHHCNPHHPPKTGSLELKKKQQKIYINVNFILKNTFKKCKIALLRSLQVNFVMCHVRRASDIFLQALYVLFKQDSYHCSNVEFTT